jgi:transposase
MILQKLKRFSDYLIESRGDDLPYLLAVTKAYRSTRDRQDHGKQLFLALILCAAFDTQFWDETQSFSGSLEELEGALEETRSIYSDSCLKICQRCSGKLLREAISDLSEEEIYKIIKEYTEKYAADRFN